MHAVISVYCISTRGIAGAYVLNLIDPNKKIIKRWAKYPNRHFAKENMQMANTHAKHA